MVVAMVAMALATTPLAAVSSPSSLAPTVIVLDLSNATSTIDSPFFFSYTIDIFQLNGPTHCNFQSAYIRNAARALGPAMLRVGGNQGDTLYYNVSAATHRQPPPSPPSSSSPRPPPPPSSSSSSSPLFPNPKRGKNTISIVDRYASATLDPAHSLVPPSLLSRLLRIAASTTTTTTNNQRHNQNHNHNHNHHYNHHVGGSSATETQQTDPLPPGYTAYFNFSRFDELAAFADDIGACIVLGINAGVGPRLSPSSSPSFSPSSSPPSSSSYSSSSASASASSSSSSSSSPSSSSSSSSLLKSPPSSQSSPTSLPTSPGVNLLPVDDKPWTPDNAEQLMLYLNATYTNDTICGYELGNEPNFFFFHFGWNWTVSAVQLARDMKVFAGTLVIAAAFFFTEKAFLAAATDHHQRHYYRYHDQSLPHPTTTTTTTTRGVATPLPQSQSTTTITHPHRLYQIWWVLSTLPSSG